MHCNAPTDFKSSDCNLSQENGPWKIRAAKSTMEMEICALKKHRGGNRGTTLLFQLATFCCLCWIAADGKEMRLRADAGFCCFLCCKVSLCFVRLSFHVIIIPLLYLLSFAFLCVFYYSFSFAVPIVCAVSPGACALTLLPLSHLTPLDGKWLFLLAADIVYSPVSVCCSLPQSYFKLPAYWTLGVTWCNRKTPIKLLELCCALTATQFPLHETWHLYRKSPYESF